MAVLIKLSLVIGGVAPKSVAESVFPKSRLLVGSLNPGSPNPKSLVGEVSSPGQFTPGSQHLSAPLSAV